MSAIAFANDLNQKVPQKLLGVRLARVHGARGPVDQIPEADLISRSVSDEGHWHMNSKVRESARRVTIDRLLQSRCMTS